MDRDHHLDAPDNESLRTIAQLDDHSELSTIYPHPHSEWDGELISRDEREKKREDERLRISLSLRKWFLAIGLLIPLPFVFVAILITVTAHYTNIKDLGYLLLPLLVGIGFAVFGTYRGFKYGYKIFYTHGIKAGPFITFLLGLLLLSLNALFLLTQPLHTGELGIDTLIISASVFVASVLYSLLLVFIWSSPRLSSARKIALAGMLALIPIIATVLLNVF